MSNASIRDALKVNPLSHHIQSLAKPQIDIFLERQVNLAQGSGSVRVDYAARSGLNPRARQVAWAGRAGPANDNAE